MIKKKINAQLTNMKYKATEDDAPREVVVEEGERIKKGGTFFLTTAGSPGSSALAVASRSSSTGGSWSCESHFKHIEDHHPIP